jgi:hypothetical protein
VITMSDYGPREPEPRPRACTNCGAPLPPGAEYCPECGQPVRRQGSGVSPWMVALAAFALGALVAFVITYASTSGTSTVTDHSTVPAKHADTSTSSTTPETVTARKTVTKPANTVTSTTTATSTSTTTATSTTTSTTTTSSST